MQNDWKRDPIWQLIGVVFNAAGLLVAIVLAPPDKQTWLIIICLLGCLVTAFLLLQHRVQAVSRYLHTIRWQNVADIWNALKNDQRFMVAILAVSMVCLVYVYLYSVFKVRFPLPGNVSLVIGIICTIVCALTGIICQHILSFHFQERRERQRELQVTKDN